MTEFTVIAEALVGQYHIDRELGRGGFATVFLAQDLRHDRPVALKLLHPEIAATLGTERFKQEVRLAARLQHPHIVGVLDSGEIVPSMAARGTSDGPHHLWFTMPYVEGESLRHRLTRERQLPIGDAIRIAREVADALDFAHRHGVIHRDIKPENILLSEGHAMVADFGIARALGTGSMTQTGIAMGTPAYMSPEQASDAATADARTDVYSLGCVLYEMLVGEAPFTGPTTQAIMSRVLTETPRPLRATRPLVSPTLEAVAMRAMSRVPADRFATASEFASALAVAADETRTPAAITALSGAETVQVPGSATAVTVPRARPFVPAIVAAVILVLGAGGIAWWELGSSGSKETKRLAVLPFENLGAREDDYFADGITDEVRGKLAALQGFQVTARASAAQYKNVGTKTPHQIGQELGVDYLLTGTLRWERGQGENRRLRVSPELVQVSTGSTRWQQPFDTDVKNVFDVQAEIASRVAQALDVELVGGAKASLEAKPTSDVAAYDAFLRGEETSQSLAITDPVQLRRAMSYYQQAVSLDPRFIQAWAQLSRAACAQSSAASTLDDVELCRRAAERAVELGPTRAEARLAMGGYLRAGAKNFEKGLAEFRAGLAEQPNSVALLAAAASAERELGRFDDALAHSQQAARLDPRSLIAANSLARTLHDTHRLQEADAEYARALALAPANLRTVQSRATNYLSLGDLAGARAVIATALSHVAARDVIVRFATFQEMMWVLPDELRNQVVQLQPADFDNDRAMWALKVGATHLLMKDVAQARSYGRIAADEYGAAVKRHGDDAQRLELLARSLALAGDNQAAIAAGERSLALRETTADASNGPYYKYQVARVLVQTGQHDRALDLIEPLLSMPGDLTPGWLRIDPAFSPLRGNARFDRLIK
ncbi:MAG TPA: protein kinase [Vicinamibacterales bacterium]|nr:protein kinase [Vicinamibacterales bacterium]